MSADTRNGDNFFVENEVYYHIQTLKPYQPVKWEVGQTHFIGRNKNTFFGFYDNNCYGIEHGTNDEYKKALNGYLKLTREFIFEEVRKEFFPNLPSRNRCMWVIPIDKDAIQYWWKELKECGQILKLELTGKIYRTNQQYLKISIAPLNAIRMDAFRYWSGASGDNPAEDEYLFEGFAKVLEICDYSQLTND